MKGNHLSVARKLQIKDLDVAQSLNLMKPMKFTMEKLRNNSYFYHTK